MARAGPAKQAPAKVEGRHPVVDQIVLLAVDEKEVELSEAAGLSGSYLSQVRRGLIKEVSIERIAKIADILGYEIVLRKKPPVPRMRKTYDITFGGWRKRWTP